MGTQGPELAAGRAGGLAAHLLQGPDGGDVEEDQGRQGRDGGQQGVQGHAVEFVVGRGLSQLRGEDLDVLVLLGVEQGHVPDQPSLGGHQEAPVERKERK